MFGVRVSILGLIVALCGVGCLYPPVTQPPPDAQQEVVIPLPYDLAWDAVNAVITKNSFHVQAQDMTNGIIEAAAPSGGDHRRGARDVQLVGKRPVASGDRCRLRLARNPGIESAARGAGRGENDASSGVRQAERRAASGCILD